MKALPYTLFILIALMMLSCETDPPNPFDVYNQIPVDTNQIDVSATSIEGLYKNIFKPTCANSGCHDGSFEPDFRTIESSYNTLVYHPLIKNDVDDPIDYRVKAGDHQNSILYRRLTKDLGGNSGIMPLLIDPGNDWEEKKDEYIKNISDWIDGGAKDIMGQTATIVDRAPQMTGFAAKKPGSNPIYPRDFGNGSIIIPFGEPTIEIYLGVSDLESPISNLSVISLEISKSRDHFANAQVYSMTYLSNPPSEIGYSGQNVDYQFRATVDDPDNIWDLGETAFARILIQDPLQNDVTMIPGRFSADHLKIYFSIQLQ
ncbi:MAG: hypothetical protein HKN92_10840 [Chitinophagales bacterium]|nr:hypothetical protein [Chitinophagales bacterium]